MTSWVSTLLEVTSKPISAMFGIAEKAVGIPEHEGLKHQLAIDVFADSYFRKVDKRHADQTVPIGSVMRIGRRGYRHYGIIVDKNAVIHYTGEKGDFGGKITVRETALDHFIDKADRFEILNFDGAKQTFSSQKTVDRARSRLGEDRYDFLRHNCQHFAFWCKIGQSVSAQAPFWSEPHPAAASFSGPRVPDWLGMYGVSVERVIFVANLKR